MKGDYFPSSALPPQSWVLDKFKRNLRVVTETSKFTFFFPVALELRNSVYLFLLLKEKHIKFLTNHYNNTHTQFFFKKETWSKRTTGFWYILKKKNQTTATTEAQVCKTVELLLKNRFELKQISAVHWIALSRSLNLCVCLNLHICKLRILIPYFTRT